MATFPTRFGPSEQRPDFDAILEELRPALRSGIADLAEKLLGPPNKDTRRKREWRWGSKGSFRIYVGGPKQGACADFDGEWKGDPLALIMRERRCDFIGAVQYGCSFAGLAFDGQATPEDPSIRAEREAERAKQKAEREAEQEADESTRIAHARRLWDASRPVDRTVGETYLTVTRGIPRPSQGWPDSVRYHAYSRSLILCGTTDDGSVHFVQRVYLTHDAQKISKKEVETRGLVAVKQTSGIMDGAFVRLPGPADGPLLLAEGPETALSLWSATGYEVWASIGPITRHVPPLGRRVVVCRDDSKLQSSIDQGLKRNLTRWTNSGADVVVATPWAVRRNDESDFNNVIQEGGVEAVRTRIAAALEPPHNPVHRVTVEEGRSATKKAASRFYQVLRLYDARLRSLTSAARAELTANAPFAPEVIASRQARASARAASLEARALKRVRRATAEIIAAAETAEHTAKIAREEARQASAKAKDFRGETAKIQEEIRKQARAKALEQAGPSPVHGIRVDVGTGKSTANLEEAVPLICEFRAARDKRTLAVAIPAHTLGDQQAERLAAMASATGISAGVWRSRRAPDPNHPDYTDNSIPKENKAKMCRDIDAVADAEEALADVQTSVCTNPKTGKHCRFIDECPFQKQKDARHDAWFVAHELIYSGKPSEIGDVAALVVDESAWQDGLFGVGDSNFLLLSTLLSEDATVPFEPLSTEQLKSTRRAAFNALSSLPVPPEGEHLLPALKSVMIAHGIDEAAAREAYGSEWKRKVEADIYPGMPRRQRKDAVQAVVHNKLVAKLGSFWKAVESLVAHKGPERSGWLSIGTHQSKDGTAPAIYIKGRKEVHQSWHVPTLLMDATMQPDLVRMFWPTMELAADVRVMTPHQHVTQVLDRSYSLGQLGKDKGLHEVHAIICREARRYAPGLILVVAQQSVEEALKAIGHLPNNVSMAHHNNIAGRDEWGDVALQIVIGRTAPSPSDVESQAEALTGIAIDPIDGWYPKADAYREVADGTFRLCQTDQHPDPIAEAVRWSICEGELVQIVGRPRGVNRTEDNPVDVLVMSNPPIPVRVERLIGEKDLGPSPDDLMMAAGGVCLKSPTDAAAAYPELWDDREEAKKAFQRWETEVGTKSPIWGHSVIGVSYYEMSPDAPDLSQPLLSVEYRVTGNGREPTLACYDPRLVPDIAARLSDRVGEVDWCGKKPEPRVEPNAVEKMAAAGLVLGGAHAVAFYPDLFASGVEAAKKAVSRAFGGWDAGFFECMKRAPCRVRYQVAGAGCKVALLFCSRERLPGLRSELEATLGVLSAFQVVSQSGLPSLTVIDGGGFLVDGLDAIMSEMPVPLMLSGKRALDYIRTRHPGPLPEASVIMTALAVRGRERLGIYA